MADCSPRHRVETQLQLYMDMVAERFRRSFGRTLISIAFGVARYRAEYAIHKSP